MWTKIRDGTLENLFIQHFVLVLDFSLVFVFFRHIINEDLSMAALKSHIYFSRHIFLIRICSVIAKKYDLYSVN